MKKQINQLIEWHKKYGVPYKDAFDYTPLPESVITLRKRIMIEEVKEWASAADAECLIEDRAKELADILYTVFGTIITEGLQDRIEQVFDAVHESNMSKNGGVRADGKILKGDGYVEPNLNFLHS